MNDRGRFGCFSKRYMLTSVTLSAADDIFQVTITRGGMVWVHITVTPLFSIGTRFLFYLKSSELWTSIFLALQSHSVLLYI